MKTTILGITLLAAVSAVAQTTPTVSDDFKPSSLNQPGQQYPQVNSQGYARFRIVAPQAQAVTVGLGLGGNGGTPLAKGDDGAWIGTTSQPMEEGFHYYHLTIDGGTFNDPGTGNFYGSTRWEPTARRIVPLYIRHRTTTKKRASIIQCSIFSMAGARMKLLGSTKATPI